MKMDFVVAWPKYHAYGQVYDAIPMFIDRLTRKRVYIPCSEENEWGRPQKPQLTYSYGIFSPDAAYQ